VNQVAKDNELLDIAKDYFQFVTTFFEVINVSAPHIYHSALELCPTSSIIRQLYYHQRIACLPKVVIGAPDSWDLTTGISTKDNYNGLCAWSPCGRFVAAHTGKAAEIRDQLTLELITTLQPTETIPHPTGPLAYSPDGHSIACASNTAIIIWDIQTGGVAKEVERSTASISLVWSSDGQVLCAIGWMDGVTFVVHTYDVSSGTTLSSGTLESRDNPHLWIYDESFRVMKTVWGSHWNDFIRIKILEVGSTLTEIQSFVLPLQNLRQVIVRSFSPTTHRISISDGDSIFSIWDIQNSKRLLQASAKPDSHSFSPDGSLFAASRVDGVFVWTYASGCFTPSRKFQCWDFFNSLQFSPTLSSILGHSGDILRVWYLHELATASRHHGRLFVGLSRSGTRVAIARDLGYTITIADPLAQTPPQFIDVGAEIEGLVITGNVLLVQGLQEVVAWLLTEEGLVDGVVGERRVERSDSIWTISHLQGPYEFQVEDQVGVIEPDEGGSTHVYHTETGEVLHPTQTPRDSDGSWVSLTKAHCGQDYLHYHNVSQCDTSPRDSWQFLQATLREGWIKDPEGKHRLWVPVEWRDYWNPADWRHDVTIQFSFIEGKPVLIKF